MTTKNEIKCPKCGEVFQVDETQYASIVKQIKDKEFTKELKKAKAQLEMENESKLKVAKFEMGKEYDIGLAAQQAKIMKLESEVRSNKIARNAEISDILAQKDKEVSELQNKLDSFNKDKQLEIANIVTDMSNKLSAQEKFIPKLTNENELAVKEHQLNEQTLKEKYLLLLQEIMVLLKRLHIIYFIR